MHFHPITDISIFLCVALYVSLFTFKQVLYITTDGFAFLLVLHHLPCPQINNAGRASPEKREVTEDGLEMTMATNHFGHFLQTNLLLGEHSGPLTKSSQ